MAVDYATLEPQKLQPDTSVAQEPEITLVPSDVLSAPDPPEPIFDGGPTPGTLAEVTGESGGFKSAFTLIQGCAKAAGMTIFPTYAIRESGNVIFLGYEDVPAIIRFRLESIRERYPQIDHREMLTSGSIKFFCTPGMPLFESVSGNVAPTPMFRKFRELVLAEHPSVAVIDPLSGAAYLQNENSNSEMGVVAAHLADLAAASNAVILLVHHTNKIGSGTDSQHSARGASSLACRARWIMQLRPKDETIQATNVKNSYRKKAPAVTFRVLEHGVLNEMIPEARDPQNVARFIQAWLLTHLEAKITPDGLYQHSKGDGNWLYRDLIASFPWIQGQHLREAVHIGVGNHLFIKADGKDRSGNKKQYLQAQEPLEDEENETLY